MCFFEGLCLFLFFRSLALTCLVNSDEKQRIYFLSPNVASFNALSIGNKKSAIHPFIKTFSIHIIAISKSWFRPTITDHSIELPGFRIPFRRDHNEHGGGVCLYIAGQISGTRPTDLLTSNCSGYIQHPAVPYSSAATIFDNDVL